MKHSSIYITLLFCFVIDYAAVAQIDPNLDARLDRRTITLETTTLPYRLYVPSDYSETLQYPLLLFLHGARWAGTDNETQLDNELALYWIDSTRQMQSPCFVVYPQIPVGTVWEQHTGVIDEFQANLHLEMMMVLIDSLSSEFSINPQQLYVCGKSIGALGVYGLISRYPNQFAAAIPAAGHYVYNEFSNILNTSMWIFHNRDDNVVPAEQPREIVRRLWENSAQVWLTHCDFRTGECDTMSTDSISILISQSATHFYSEFDEAGHQLEHNVVQTFGLYDWVLRQTKTVNTVNIENRSVQHFQLFPNYPNPFNPRTTISFAIAQPARVLVEILNNCGQTLQTVINSVKPAGQFSLQIDLSSEASGVYFCRLTVYPNQGKTGTTIRKMLLLR